MLATSSVQSTNHVRIHVAITICSVRFVTSGVLADQSLYLRSSPRSKIVFRTINIITHIIINIIYVMRRRS
jgi:hypothetical protein